MAFVKLTRPSNTFVYINSNLIESIFLHPNGNSRVIIDGGDENYWDVVETPEEIVKLIKQANNGQSNTNKTSKRK